jgi:hypothetical protein
MRVGDPVLSEERAKALSELARLSLGRVGPESPNAVAFLERISLTHVGPTQDHDRHVITHAMLLVCRYCARQAAAMAAYFRSLGIRDGTVEETPDRDLSWFSLNRVEGPDAPNEMDRLSLSQHEARDPWSEMDRLSLSQHEARDSWSEMDRLSLSRSPSAVHRGPAPAGPAAGAAPPCELDYVDEAETNFD